MSCLSCTLFVSLSLVHSLHKSLPNPSHSCHKELRCFSSGFCSPNSSSSPFSFPALPPHLHIFSSCDSVFQMSPLKSSRKPLFSCPVFLLFLLLLGIAIKHMGSGGGETAPVLMILLPSICACRAIHISPLRASTSPHSSAG